MSVGRDRLPLVLLGIYFVWWSALAITPRYREDWLLENLLVFIAVPVLVLTYRRLRFSNGAYVCIVVFLMLHAVGAHYTYAEVPYDAWTKRLTGSTLSVWFGFERNHFDRLVHVAYGALILPAAVEFLDVVAPSRGGWRLVLPVIFMNAHGVIYEVLEWLAAEVFGGDLGVAYLGTQGDVWDAQKDMGLAFLGSVIAMTVLAVTRRRESSAGAAA